MKKIERRLERQTRELNRAQTKLVQFHAETPMRSLSSVLLRPISIHSHSESTIPSMIQPSSSQPLFDCTINLFPLSHQKATKSLQTEETIFYKRRPETSPMPQFHQKSQLHHTDHSLGKIPLNPVGFNVDEIYWETEGITSSYLGSCARPSSINYRDHTASGVDSLQDYIPESTLCYTELLCPLTHLSQNYEIDPIADSELFSTLVLRFGPTPATAFAALCESPGKGYIRILHCKAQIIQRGWRRYVRRVANQLAQTVSYLWIRRGKKAILLRHRCLQHQLQLFSAKCLQYWLRYTKLIVCKILFSPVFLPFLLTVYPFINACSYRIYSIHDYSNHLFSRDSHVPSTCLVSRNYKLNLF